MSAAHGMSRPDVLRWLLFQHVYGWPVLDNLKAWKHKKEADEARQRAIGSGLMFSPKQAERSERRITAQLLGKSVEDFKLWMPLPLRAELVRLARAETLGLSDYIRKTLVRVLLGKSFHHRWQEAIGKLPGEVLQLEKDQSI